MTCTVKHKIRALPREYLGGQISDLYETKQVLDFFDRIDMISVIVDELLMDRWFHQIRT